jgi:hypothetical protein
MYAGVGPSTPSGRDDEDNDCCDSPHVAKLMSDPGIATGRASVIRPLRRCPGQENGVLPVPPTGETIVLKSLRDLLTEDLIELPLQCAVNLSYFLEEHVRRLRRRFTAPPAAVVANRPR